MRTIATVLKGLGIFLAALCGLGFLYQLIGSALDAKYAPPRTQMVRLEGHDAHVFCTGAGTRTYLLDAGAGVGAFEWEELVPLLAKTGRVCAFDRPGLGWSDDTGDAHDIAAQVRWIGTLVRTARIPRPFVYVGHSLGGDDAMLYRQLHPEDVAALILLEPAWPRDVFARYRGTRDDAMRGEDCPLSCRALPALGWLGFMRLFARLQSATSHGPPSRMNAEYSAQVARPAFYKTLIATVHALPKSAYEIQDVKTFGGTPVLLLTSSQPRRRGATETPAAFAAWRREQLAWFRQLAGMSAHGAGPLTISNSMHATMVATPHAAEQVATDIVAFLSAVCRPACTGAKS